MALIGAGTVLAGRYEIGEHIASGGMGDVWQGVDRVLGRTVAVKLLRAPSDEPEFAFAGRFVAEARTMATISHPGVVDVYDFGDDPAAGMYLVMKYIEGESLERALDRDGRLPPAATMRLVAEAAEALHAAHDKGVTHRDIKPANLLLRPDGSTVLTDFGIARSAAATHQTSTGLLLGTASYIAPERAAGDPATAQSDIYSLGVVAYRCLAGRLPFVGESLLQIALRHANDEVPPLPGDVPPGVRAVVERALAKDPAQRWPSGAAFAAAARAALSTTRVETAVPVPAPNRRRLLLVAGAGLVAAAVVAAAVFLPGRDGGRGVGVAATTAPADSAGLGAGGAVPATAPSSAAPVPASASARPTLPTGTPPAGAPSVPANLTATPVNATTIRLQWKDTSSNETGFTVINGATSRTAAANATTLTWDGLAPDTRMCFKVRADNAAGGSAYFPAAQQDWVCAVTLPGTGPAAPSGLTATPVSATAIRLQWTDNSTDEAGFTVINGETSRSAGTNATSYTWDGLTPGTYMCFKVRAHNPAGVSAYSPPAQQDWACTTTPSA
ncbi:protein kinase domain-containing protein [Dactylosporangium siamense]|uniref:protein kinase domain-containing protein n=1 Tax=Dactylosporangium siamense TaxID=685454 RepID=UPI0031F16530